MSFSAAALRFNPDAAAYSSSSLSELGLSVNVTRL
jgi:hypothetical protein